MQAYLDLMRHVLDNGTDKQDRTGTKCGLICKTVSRF